MNFNPAEFMGDLETKDTSSTNPFLATENAPYMSSSGAIPERRHNEVRRFSERSGVETKSEFRTENQLSQKKEREEPNHRLSIHKNIVDRLDEFIAKKQIPHIIFHGPSGSGKQTIVREFIQRIYDGDKIKMKTHVMTVNCSHGKGIQFIRDELKFFAKANAQTKSNVEGGKSSEFKVIMLLNAHHLTVDAQSALRRCIELFSYNTRFFIVVENKDKLLNPILSRFCDIFVPEPCIDNMTESVTSAAHSSLATALNGKRCNLHSYVLSTQFRAMEEKCREVKSAKMQIIDDVFREEYGETPKPFHLFSFMQKINYLYELGISCLDLMEWIESRRDIWSETEYYRAVMRFYQIKPQFRCEKLLMLFMMNYLGDLQ